ncbi:MAG: oligoendopeptidase F [Candidatus Neomarinimicrobiota bacterium]|nr:MAG: oligoendopeptidase F [Candidatus Neomarinimicrobiota bacterium]
MKKITGVLIVLMVFSFFSNQVLSQTRDRSEIADQYKWDLTDLYPSEETFQKAKDATVKKFDGILDFKGKLTKSPQNLLNGLDYHTAIIKEMMRLSSYAGKLSDLDTRDSKYLAMRQEISQLFTQYNSKSSFIDPEILTMNKKKIDKFLTKEPKLEVYKFYLYDLLRSKEHMLSAKEEKIVAEAGLITGAGESIYGIFKNADMPYPTVTLSNGKEVLVDQAGYGRYRASANREDRKKVFEAFFGKFNDFRRTFGTEMDANVKSHLFYTNVRNYDNTLETALDANNIPVEVYYSLIDNVNKNLDSFHRYLNIKRRMMGLDTLYYYDLYAPAVKDIDAEYDYDKAKKMILNALKPLGDDYVKIIKEAFDNRWIDVYPTPGKRSGAYSSGSAYDVHPYILLNYNNLYNDVSTLAHELGHTMQSYLSNKNQPFPTAMYPIFVAEVASTLNEVLLFNYVYNKTTDDDTKLALLMEYLDGVKGTLFRQTQFAEFELRMHEMAEKGEQITGDSMSELYKNIVRRYYGHDQGICIVPDYINVEWAYIPHFYYNYYVYQYSTSFTASTALAERILNKEPGAVDKYINFLSAGGSKYPIELLKDAGVDMTTSVPFDKTMKMMNWAMDEIENILAKKGM